MICIFEKEIIKERIYNLVKDYDLADKIINIFLEFRNDPENRKSLTNEKHFNLDEDLEDHPLWNGIF